MVVVDDYVANEWSYIPHFYREFYVFQYATSLTAAEALSARVSTGDRDALAPLSEISRIRGIQVSRRPVEGRRRGHDNTTILSI